ncbi:hypothetical protein [Tunicatimonas pelagia]|uniref:hypothetical protein n=1 Tax=Tunicatimonas pelagia TaxID=931531 RepID=UPI002665A1F5|nr:hypothetical protein [Tunicatimonas pelagia]WKN44685.1 hypothetical protein P0M28_06870 [Tunicatimonas pelagia]
MTMSLDNLRIGKKYYLYNYGEESRFEVLERLEDKNYRVKDLLSLDTYELSDLIKYGTSDDFEIEEIRESSL